VKISNGGGHRPEKRKNSEKKGRIYSKKEKVRKRRISLFGGSVWGSMDGRKEKKRVRKEGPIRFKQKRNASISERTKYTLKKGKNSEKRCPAERGTLSCSLENGIGRGSVDAKRKFRKKWEKPDQVAKDWIGGNEVKPCGVGGRNYRNSRGEKGGSGKNKPGNDAKKEYGMQMGEGNVNGLVKVADHSETFGNPYAKQKCFKDERTGAHAGGSAGMKRRPKSRRDGANKNSGCQGDTHSDRLKSEGEGCKMEKEKAITKEKSGGGWKKAF